MPKNSTENMVVPPTSSAYLPNSGSRRLIHWRQAVQQQAEAQADQHPLQHLLGERAGVEGGRLGQADRQDHRAAVLDPQQQLVAAAPGGRAQQHGRRARRRARCRSPGCRLPSTAWRATCAVGDDIDVDPVEDGVIDIEDPVAVAVAPPPRPECAATPLPCHAQRGVGRRRHGELADAARAACAVSLPPGSPSTVTAGHASTCGTPSSSTSAWARRAPRRAAGRTRKRQGTDVIGAAGRALVSVPRV